jgi:hypothetical protein
MKEYTILLCDRFGRHSTTLNGLFDSALHAAQWARRARDQEPFAVIRGTLSLVLSIDGYLAADLFPNGLPAPHKVSLIEAGDPVASESRRACETPGCDRPATEQMPAGEWYCTEHAPDPLPAVVRIAIEGGRPQVVTLNGRPVTAHVTDFDAQGCDPAETETGNDGRSFVRYEV